MKKIKKLLIILLSLAILAGAFYMLIYFNVIKTPAFLDRIKETASSGISKANAVILQKELKKVKEENDILKKSVTAKNHELEVLQKKLADMELLREAAEQDIQNYQAQIIELNDKLSASVEGDSSKRVTYKEMAKYYNAMNTKDAAEILSKLSDEDVIGIISAMDTDTAAEVLQKMSRDKAAAVSRKMLVTSTQ